MAAQDNVSLRVSLTYLFYILLFFRSNQEVELYPAGIASFGFVSYPYNKDNKVIAYI